MFKKLYPEFKEVTKEEFEEFLKNYPRELTPHGIYFCTPPVLEYEDFALGKWPFFTVAMCCNEDYYGVHTEWYKICTNYEKLYKRYGGDYND